MIIDSLSNKEYHDRGEFSSSLVKMMNTPAKAKHAMVSEREFRDYFRIGTAIHTKVLEPELFAEQFLIGIDVARRSKADKEKWAEFFSSNGANGANIVSNKASDWFGMFESETGKIMLAPEELKEINDMSYSVSNNEQAVALLSGGKAEQSLFWTDKETGLDLKVRPDYLGKSISDLKSVQSADPFDFSNKLFKLGYHISQAMYQDGVYQVTGEFKKFKFICVEKTAPYLCAVYSLDDESEEEAYRQYRVMLAKLAECLETDIWDGYKDMSNLSLPSYCFGK